MLSTYRYRGGNTRRIEVAYDVDHPIEEGDLVFEDPTDKFARTATDMADQGSVILNQLAFGAKFLGVAGQKVGTQPGEVSFRLNANNPKPPCITVLQDGLFEFDCDSGTKDATNGLVAIYATSSAIPNSQKIMAAATDGGLQKSRAIGILRKQPASFGTDTPDTSRALIELLVGEYTGVVGIGADGTYTGTSGQ